MGFLNFFNRESTECKLRNKLATGFDEVVENVLSDPKSKSLLNDPMFGPMLIQSAIGNMYRALKNGNEFSTLSELCIKEGLDYQKILDEELDKALNKYLEFS